MIVVNGDKLKEVDQKRLYVVFSFNIKDSYEDELREWLKNTGEPYFKKLPFVKSVTTYLREFGIGQRPQFQSWLEIAGYESLKFLEKWRGDAERKTIFKEWFELITDFNATILRET